MRAIANPLTVTIRCHPCLRYDLLPMSPGWTRAAGHELMAEREWDSRFPICPKNPVK